MHMMKKNECSIGDTSEDHGNSSIEQDKALETGGSSGESEIRQATSYELLSYEPWN